MSETKKGETDKVADNHFVSTLPTRKEIAVLSPVEASRRTVQAFREAQKELVRRGIKPTLANASQMLLGGASTSAYQGAVNHLRAVEMFGISPMLPKDEAVRRLRLLEPAIQRLAADLDEVKDTRSDPEILADAISLLIVHAGRELTGLDTSVIRGFLMRDSRKRGSTKSALIDLIRWLQSLETGL